MAVAFATLHVSCASGPQPSCKSSQNEPQLQHVKSTAIQHRDPGAIIVESQQVDEAEVDEMWSLVGKKAEQRWLWQAMDHGTGVV